MSVAPGDAAWLRPGWDAPAAVQAVATTRQAPGGSLPPFDRCNLGTRSGDQAAAVASNRAAVHAALQLPAEPRWLQQVHGTGVVRWQRDSPVAEPVADAAVTSEAGVVLAVLTADCLPVLIAARDGGEIAAVHAGWRGLAAGVIEATLAQMRSAPSALMAWIGPCIRTGSYEVGDEVRQAFIAQDAGSAAAFVARAAGHWSCDLPALASQRLRRAGIAAVHDCGRDTAAEPASFFSYRRDGVSGRMASLIWIAP